MHPYGVPTAMVVTKVMQEMELRHIMGIVMLLAASVVAQPAAAQCFSEALPALAEATSREDSLALAEQYRHNPPGGDEECGRLLAGYIIGISSTPAESEWRHRLDGYELLESVFRNHSGEARVHFAMGILLYHRQARTDARRALERALDRADESEVPLTQREIAIIHYNIGLMHQDFWRDWRSYGYVVAASGGQWHCGQYQAGERSNIANSSNDNSKYCFAKPAKNLYGFEDSSNLVIGIPNNTPSVLTRLLRALS